MKLIPRIHRYTAFLAMFASGLAGQSGSDTLELIQPNSLQADVAFLASNDMKGRTAGSPEDHIAADYVATGFMRAHLRPMGDKGTYFQNLGIVTADLDRDHTSLTAKVAGVEHSYVLNKDFRWARQSLHADSQCGGLVFAGYGINAPEYDYNDFAGLDLKGKVVLLLNREPQANDSSARFAGTWDTYHAFYWQKVEEVRKLGAVGLLFIDDRVRRVVKVTPASSPRASGGPNFALDEEMWNIPVFNITPDVADQLLAPSGRNVSELQSGIDRSLHPASFPVPDGSACLSKAVTQVQRNNGRNVVAMLEGSDPQLKSEAVLLTAHHDHMGESNGHIYNGADDDASGVAALLEIARAFDAGHLHPKRSILFVSYDGEERIFLGSYHYVTHPAIPLSKTIANINMDMIGRDENDANWPVPQDGNVNMVNVLGTRYNPGLRKVIDENNQTTGLKLDYKMDVVDPDSLWSRSDHFWFATLHIPQVEFQSGLHPDYHTDQDTWEHINYPKMTKIVRLVFLSAMQLANSSDKPKFIATAAPQ